MKDLMETNLENANVKELVEGSRRIEDDEDDEEEEEEEEQPSDDYFARSLQLVQVMLADAQRALETKVEVKGFGSNAAGAGRIQVLHADEVNDHLGIQHEESMDVIDEDTIQGRVSQAPTLRGISPSALCRVEKRNGDEHG